MGIALLLREVPNSSPILKSIIIEYYYYSKKLSESKNEKKNDNNGIRLIKEFIKNMYYTYGKEFNKKDN